MSIISAGTTQATGLNYTSNTFGNLVLQTNNGVTAVTIDTDQNVSIATGNVGIGTQTPTVSLDITATDAVKIPVGTTAQRPPASNGLFRYNTSNNSFEGYGNSGWYIISSMGNDGSTPTKAAVSANAIKTLTGTTTDGMYWLKPTGGSGVPFLAYCIMSRDGGGWVKVLQFNNSVSMATTDFVNMNQQWCGAEINLYAGKIATADWTALNSTNSFLFRVIGTDNLLNNGTGTGKLSYTGTLPAYGTDLDPTANYTLSLDMTNDGIYEYACTYTNDTRTRCNGTTNYWISDHNYNGTFVGAAPPNSAGVPQCWTIGTNQVVSNLHWMSGLSTGSAGNIVWGASASTAWAIYVK